MSAAAMELRKVVEIEPWRGDDEVKRYIRNSKAPATRTGYAGDFRRFERWCRAEGFESLPATPAAVARFATARAMEGKKVAHIRREIAAIAFTHRDKGFDPPPTTHAAVKAALEGIARSHPYAKKQAPAILPGDLLAMVQTLDLNTNRGVRDTALILAGWIGAFRRSELAAANVEDVAIQERGMLIVVPKQKNHQTAAKIKEATLAEDPRLCATLAMKRWLRVSGRTSGPLFTSVIYGDHMTDVRISGETVNRAVQRAASDAGLSEMNYTAHSLRSGFITHSFQKGKDAVVIQQQTGHESVNTLAGYNRRAMALGDQSPTANLI